MSEQQNVAIVKQAYAAFKQGNIQQLLGYMSADVDWESMVGSGNLLPTSGRRMGLEAVTRFFAQIDSNYTFQQFEPREFIAQNDRVVALGHYHGTVKPTGKSFSSAWVMVFTVRDGKITNFQEYADTAALAAAVNAPVHA
jgi:hypothetical protein